MQIKQIQSYKTVSVIAVVASLVSLQTVYQHQTLFFISMAVAILCSLMLALASFSMFGRYGVELFRSLKAIDVTNFAVGLTLTVLVPILWFLCVAKFVIVPLTLSNNTDETVLISGGTFTLINGLFGIIYFYIIWPFKSRRLASNC